MTTIYWNQFALTPAPGPRPYVLVTPNGPTDGGDFGPNSTIWSGGTGLSETGGIQEALFWLGSNATGGGTVYVTGGDYSISSGIALTGSNQVVIFEGGVTLTFTSGATPISDTNLGSVWIALASSYGFNSLYNNFSHVALYGNGCTIDLSETTTNATVFGIMQYGNFDSHGASPWYGGEDFVVDGFVLPTTPPGCPAFWIGVDHYTTLPIAGTSDTSNGTLQKLRNVRISRLYYTTISAEFSSGGPNPTYIQGAWHDVLIEDCSFDLFALTGTTNCGGLLVRANAGDAEQLVVRRCYFRTANGSQPIVVQIQGNSSANNPSETRTCQLIYIEDSVFDSGKSTPATYGVSINDDGGTGSVGFVNNIEFRRCAFIYCKLSLASYGNLFGYVRFVDCLSESGTNFPGTSGSLTGRFPMDGNFTSVTPGTSPFTYTNQDSIDEILAVNGSSISAVYWGVSITGTLAGSGAGTYRLRPGDSITMAFTGTITISKFAV